MSVIREILEELVSLSWHDRGERIAAWVKDSTVETYAHPAGHSGGGTSIPPLVRNIVRPAERPRLVLGAHYDIHPGTVEGALDNAASCAVLVALADRLTPAMSDVEICFWDCEEVPNGAMLGSRRYVEGRPADLRSELVVVLDVVGLGVPVVGESWRNVSASAMGHLVRSEYGGQIFPVPPSDHHSFRGTPNGAALLCSIHPDRGRALWALTHTPMDRIELIDFGSLDACVDLLERVVADMHAEERPAWYRRGREQADGQGSLQAPLSAPRV